MQTRRQTRIFVHGFGPLVSTDEDWIFHQASLGKHHHTWHSQGLGAYHSPHFLVALESGSRVGCENPT